MNVGATCGYKTETHGARKDILPLSIETVTPVCLSNACASLSQQLVGMSLQLPVVKFQIFATAQFLFADHAYGVFLPSYIQQPVRVSLLAARYPNARYRTIETVINDYLDKMCHVLRIPMCALNRMLQSR